MRSHIVCLTVACILVASAVASATRYDPRLHFRTIATKRFDIHFHQGEDAEARRLAVIAEDVATALNATLGPANGRVHVILVNQSDLPNGWATPVPYNVIEIAAAGPRGGSLIGNTDDWLRLVFTHEYTHIVHLGRTRGWIGGLQYVFGRNPALFPNLAMPLWSIEGIATFEESHQTGHGRTNAGDFRQILTSAAAASRFEPLDRASGGLDDWPSGNAQYVYGGMFHRYLAETYGLESVRRLTDDTAGRVPYFGTPAFRRVYGKSLGKLWSDFEAATGGQESAAPITARRMTMTGFSVSAPRFGEAGRLFYSVANPDGFPALMEVGSDAGAPRRVANRYLGNTLAVAGDLLVFDEMRVVENVALQSDLEALDIRDGRRTALTSGLRAADPDVSSDRRQIAFTVQRDDRRDVVVAPFTVTGPAVGAPRVLASAAGVEYASPRWSPDGTTVAVEQHRRGFLSDIVLIDASTGATRVAATFDNGRCVSPAWMPDGRRLIFAATRDDRPFQLFALDVVAGTLARLEGTGPSATSPDVSRDGQTLVFVGYTPAGYDLFTMSLAAAVWTPASTGSVPPAASATSDDTTGPAVHRYSPFRSLAPRYWTPVILSDAGETEFGAETSGSDALGRHNYSANVRWATARGRPDWQASYAYDRWWPLLFANLSDDTDPYGPGEARSREVNAGAVFPWAHVRWSQSVLAAANIAADTIVCAECPRPIDLRADRRSLRAGYTFSSARSYGYSISREEGWSATATEDSIGEWLGSDGSAGSVVADVRGYHRLFSQHQVIAARAAVASSWGDEGVRRAFTAGGSGPRPGGFLFDSDAVGLVRGFDDGIPGWHAAVANLDVRFPIVRVQRGLGTFPAFIRVIHGAVFVDAGHAWDDAFRRKDIRLSSGVELSADTVLGYSLPVTITGGLAIRHDGLDRTSSVTVFGRIGRAF